MKHNLALLQQCITHLRANHGPDDDLNAWDVLSLLEVLVNDLALIYGKPEEADEG